MIKIIPQSDYKVSNWSGGTTSEIWIQPETASFKEDNYEARISLASVVLEQSEFTPLPGVERTLTVLEGTHSLSLNDRGFVPVMPYTPVTFSGDDKTESKGKALNFNFMKKTNKPHEVTIMQVDKEERLVLLPNHENALVYIISGEANTPQGDLNAKDSVAFDEELLISMKAKTLFVKVDY